MDHLNTDLIITHPDVVFYDFYEAWDKPIESDKNLYLDKRSGILAQAAPNIGPMVSPAPECWNGAHESELMKLNRRSGKR
jgi:hypothetical protein